MTFTIKTNIIFEHFYGSCMGLSAVGLIIGVNVGTHIFWHFFVSFLNILGKFSRHGEGVSSYITNLYNTTSKQEKEKKEKKRSTQRRRAHLKKGVLISMDNRIQRQHCGEGDIWYYVPPWTFVGGRNPPPLLTPMGLMKVIPYRQTIFCSWKFEFNHPQHLMETAWDSEKYIATCLHVGRN